MANKLVSFWMTALWPQVEQRRARFSLLDVLPFFSFLMSVRTVLFLYKERRGGEIRTTKQQESRKKTKRTSVFDKVLTERLLWVVQRWCSAHTRARKHGKDMCLPSVKTWEMEYSNLYNLFDSGELKKMFPDESPYIVKWNKNVK